MKVMMMMMMMMVINDDEKIIIGMKVFFALPENRTMNTE